MHYIIIKSLSYNFHAILFCVEVYQHKNGHIGNIGIDNDILIKVYWPISFITAGIYYLFK